MAVYSMAVYSMVVYSMAVYSMAVYSMAVYSMVVYSMAVYSMAVYSMALYSMAVYSMAVYSMAVYSMAVYFIFTCYSYFSFFFDFNSFGTPFNFIFLNLFEFLTPRQSPLVETVASHMAQNAHRIENLKHNLLPSTRHENAPVSTQGLCLVL